MPRRVNLMVLVSLVIVLVLSFGVSAGVAQEQQEGDAQSALAPEGDAPQVVETTEIEAAQEELAGLRQEAEIADSVYRNANFELNQLNHAVADAVVEHADAQDSLQGAQEELGEQASRLYKNPLAFLDVLVGARSFRDFANRLGLWIQLLEGMVTDIADWRGRVDELKQIEVDLKAQVEEQQKSTEEAATLRDEATSKVGAVKEFVNTLDADLQEAIQNQEAEERALQEAEAVDLLTELAQTQPVLVPEASGIPGMEEPIADAVMDQGTLAEEDLMALQASSKEAEAAAAEAAAAQQAADQAARDAAERVAASMAAPNAADVAAAEIAAAEKKAAEEKAAADKAAESQAVAEKAAATDAANKAAAEKAAAEKAAATDAANKAAAERAAAADAANKAVAEKAAEKKAAGEKAAAGKAAEGKAAAEKAAAEKKALEEKAAAERATIDRAAVEAANRAKAAQEAAKQASEDAAKKAATAEQTRQKAAGVPPTATAGAAATGQPKEGQPKEGQATPPAPATGSASAAVAEAATYTGVPYVWGGESRDGLDCTGLTILAFRKLGISLPHSVEGQYGYGRPVSGPPAAGDLVFYDEDGSGLSHVGIATGRGTIVHASAFVGFVAESPIDSTPGRLPEARRLL